MKYSKLDAKDYARGEHEGHLGRGHEPFNEDFSFNEEGLRRNIRHWIDDLAIQGLFIAGKQGEFAHHVAGRAQGQHGDRGGRVRGQGRHHHVLLRPDFDVVVELARHAEAVGADYIVVHAPMLHFITDRDDTVYNYYKSVCDQVNLGIAMWSHPDSGYLMSPGACAHGWQSCPTSWPSSTRCPGPCTPT